MTLRSTPVISGMGRLLIGFALALAVATALAGSVVYLVAGVQLTAEVDESLSHERRHLLPPGASADAGALVTRIAALEAGRSLTDRGHVLYDAQGQRLTGRLTMALPAPGYSNVLYRDGGVKWHSGRALCVALPGGGHLVIVAHSEIGENMRQMVLPAAIGVVLAGVIAGLAGSWLFARMLARRLLQAQGAADAIARGDLTGRIPLEGLDGVFAEQALSLNRMLDRMAEMVRSHRQFAAHVAHDLRTPLTRLRGILADDLASAPNDRAVFVERADRECASILAIFDSLLRLSEIEAGSHSAGLAPLALRQVIEDVAETMDPVIADAGGRLCVGPMEHATVLADVGLVHQVLVNLLENIALHTPRGTCATIALQHDTACGEAVITVVDDGPGIALAERALVTRPFVRGIGVGRHRGSGLGLAIAEAIMRFHGGTLELADAEPGLAVILRLPLVNYGAGTADPKRSAAA